jgi:hypothetical protein
LETGFSYQTLGVLGGISMSKRRAEQGRQPADGLKVGDFECACARYQFEEPNNLVISQYRNGELALVRWWRDGPARRARRGRLGLHGRQAERMFCDVNRCPNFRNHASRCRAINKLPVLIESDSHAGCSRQETRSLSQQLHGSMKFQRR